MCRGLRVKNKKKRPFGRFEISVRLDQPLAGFFFKLDLGNGAGVETLSPFRVPANLMAS